MVKTLNVTLAIKVDSDVEKVSNIVDRLSFEEIPSDDVVEVKKIEVVDFFEIY